MVGDAEARALAAAVAHCEISRGPSISRFERNFARFLGGGHTASLISGTAAVEVAVRVTKLAGEEVVTGAMSCQATANALLAAGCRIRFADHDPETWQVSVPAIEKALTPRTRGIVVAHLYGATADLDALTALARRRRLVLVEDCAQSLGALWRGAHSGTFGDAAAFSFYGNKLITTGEGGMIRTRTAGPAAAARQMRDHGQDAPFHHAIYGLNWKMPAVLAALGLVQLRRARAFAAARRARASIHRGILGRDARIVLPAIPRHCRPAPFSFPLLVKGRSSAEIRRRLERRGIETRPLFAPQCDQPYWAAAAGRTTGRFPIARRLERHGLYLSVSPHLSKAQIQFIGETLLDVL